MKERGIKKKNAFLRGDFIKIVATVFMLGLILFMTSNFIRSVTVMTEKLRILEKVEEEVDQLRMDNLELILKKSEIVSYEYVEKEARDKLKYTKDEEIVFVIPEDLLKSEVLDEELMRAKGIDIEDSPKGPQDVLHIWIDFLFFSGV
jgi:cell division protein FtsB